jgi:peptidoglycan hydrolase CwlO-like protein
MTKDIIELVLPVTVSLVAVMYQEKQIIERLNRTVMEKQKQRVDQMDVQFGALQNSLEKVQNQVDSVKSDLGNVKERLARIEENIEHLRDTQK